MHLQRWTLTIATMVGRPRLSRRCLQRISKAHTRSSCYLHSLIPSTDPNVKRRGRGFNIRSANRDDDDVAMDTDGVRARNFDRLDEDEDDEARAGSSKAHPDDARAAKCECMVVERSHRALGYDI